MPSSHSPRRSGRRHPLMGALLLVIGLFVTGGAYAAASTGIAHAQDAPVSQEALVEEGEKLFLANCASCHGLNAEGTVAGPTLIGVGALSVDFQVGTGRMPMAASGPQAEVKPVQFTQPQITDWLLDLFQIPNNQPNQFFGVHDLFRCRAHAREINCLIALL